MTGSYNSTSRPFLFAGEHIPQYPPHIPYITCPFLKKRNLLKGIKFLEQLSPINVIYYKMLNQLKVLKICTVDFRQLKPSRNLRRSPIFDTILIPKSG